MKHHWPDAVIYDKQAEVIYSVIENDETVAPAGNMLGKDWVAAFIALYFFVSRHPAIVVTSSVDEGQLDKVLWGEIGNFISTSRYPLPIKVNYLDIRKIINGDVYKGKSYLIGRVAAKDEGLLGHHQHRGPNREPNTLMIYDESSGIKHEFKTKTDTWAHRTLVIGNPFPCENFFKHAAKEGSIPDPDVPGRYYRKVIQIRAEDSPNVQLALLQKEAGLPVTNEILVPGLLDYPEYIKRRKTWDPVRQCVSLDATFYEGAKQLLYPPDWLNAAEAAAEGLPPMRKAKAIGIDPAEGTDNTTYTAVDELGLIEQVCHKTPDTTDVTSFALAFMRKHAVPPERVFFDRGGGGKQHADRLRKMGYNVSTVGFGEGATPERRRGVTQLSQAKMNDETRYAYKNRRAEMYGLLRELLDPSLIGSKDAMPWVGHRKNVFALPYSIANRPREDGGPSLRGQLAPMPLKYDEEGRMWMLPKSKKNPDSKEECLKDLLGGFSPDEADSLVLATFGLFRQSFRPNIGAV